MENWTFTPLDQEITAELQTFIPERVFDAHAHLYRPADLNLEAPSFHSQGPPEVGIQVWQEHYARVLGASRLQGGLFMGLPTAHCDVERANDYLLSQLDQDTCQQGLICVPPHYPQEKTLAYLAHPQIVGFKPYHTFSPEKPTFQASLSSYLPEWIWELAHERELLIMLHLVKDLALADPGNQRQIQEMCLKYPRARLILAHAARGFHAPNTVAGLPALQGLQNIWFDAAAVCEPQALLAILHAFGPRKLLWGSDFPLSEMRGKAVSVGDGFVWLQPGTIDWDQVSPTCHPILVILESLRALQDAANNFGLNQEDLQDIFCDNALRLLGYQTWRDNLRSEHPQMRSYQTWRDNLRSEHPQMRSYQTWRDNLRSEHPQMRSQHPQKASAAPSGQELYQQAKKRIPGGVQLLSKRPEMMAPHQWPPYFREARGCEIWDLEGRHYYDMSTNGIGSCLLGFRDPDVTRAVQRRVNLGAMSTLNPPEEVALADLLCEIHPWAEQVRFARTGGEIAAIAIRIARATTDRSLVAICGYHGWQDWYLAANLGQDDSLRGHLMPGLEPLGVPRELRGTALTFHYNNRTEFQHILDQCGERLAAVIMEPCRYQDPEPGFLEYVRDSAHQHGALLIFDEITIGWRLHLGGAHLKLGVNPDMAIFAKALGNGHPIAAVIGAQEAMEGAHTSFISSTYWTESVGPAAALATLQKMPEYDLPAHVAQVGNRIAAHWQRHAESDGLPVVAGDGYPCLAHFRFEHELAHELRTLYTQLMLERGFLAGAAIYPTLAHTGEIVSRYGAAIEAVFSEIAEALAAGEVQARLRGPVAHSGFRRLL